MIRSVVKKGQAILSMKCTPVHDFDSAKAIVKDLSDTLSFVQSLYRFERGSGIAAPQIGVDARISVIEYSGVRTTLINPTITEHLDIKEPIREGCLSFFSEIGEVLRYKDVTVSYFDLAGQLHQMHAQGELASLVQHEIDHLDGILYDTRLVPCDALVAHPEMPHIP